MFSSLAGLAAGLVLLVLGAEVLVRASSALAILLRVSPLLVGLTIVAFGTSAPELVVSLRAALGAHPDIAMGNVIGSNIVNIGLILGVAALVKPAAVSAQLIRLDIPVMILVALFTCWTAWEGNVTRASGIALLVMFVAYVMLMLHIAKRQRSHPPLVVPPIRPKPIWRGWFLLFISIGLVILVAGATLFVDGSVDLARRLGIGEDIIGLTLVAVGTSLPELATSLVAAIRGHSDIAVGNVVGSNIFNVAAILGLTTTIIPISGSAIASHDLAVMLAFSLVFLPLAFTKGIVSRVEGGVLVGGYVAYVVWRTT